MLKTGSAARNALGVLLCALVLLLSALAASPSFHQWLHHDADNPDHECAVTLFSSGHVNAASLVPVAVVVIVFFAVLALLPQDFVPASADYRFSSSRAPPR